jgi:hypothetical protein
LTKAIDYYLEQQPKKLLRKEHTSRAEVIEDSILLFLAEKGVLEPTLKSLGVQDAEIQSIIRHLKAEYGISPKS